MCTGLASAEEKEKTVTLFDGKDTTGWHMAGPGKFDVQDGALTGHGGMGLYWNEKEFENFILELDWKTTDKGANSGIFVRFPDPKNDPWVAVKQGHEIQICDTEAHYQTGAIYSFKNPTEIASKPAGEWNHYKITVVGQHYTVELNGKKVNEFDSPDRPLKGRIGLQNHPPTDPPLVSFKDIKVTELPASADKDKGAATTKQSALKPIDVKDKQLEQGIVGQYFQNIKSLDQVAKAKEPFFVRIDKNVFFKRVEGEFFKSKLVNDFGVRWTGYIKIDKPGTYSFILRSDDGSQLRLNDRLVIDNSKFEVMQDHEEKVELQPGTYAFRVDYMNGPGGAGCQLYWKQPGEQKKSAIPLTALSHVSGAQTAIAWARDAWEKLKLQGASAEAPYAKMDYGQFFCHTIQVEENDVANKGIAIKVGDEKNPVTVCFDTELMRYAGGWTGGFLDYHGVVFDGAHGVNPGPEGDVQFVTPTEPGFSTNVKKEGEMQEPAKDPRSKPYGPLPKEVTRFKGFYRNGDRVVLSYTVGDQDVMETPGATTIGTHTYFTRTLRVGPSKRPLMLLVAQEDSNDPSGIAMTMPGGVRGALGENGRRYAILPASEQAQSYKIAWWRTNGARGEATPPVEVAEADKIVRDVEDVEALMQAGPARWTKQIETKGEVAKDESAYVVDTLTVPEANPYNAWMRFGGLDFFSDGRAAVTTWSGDVWVVSGIDDKLEHLKWKRFATGLFQPLGLKIVNDQVYVLGRDRITRFTDSNKDGEADFYESFNADCQVTPSFHEFAFDLQTDKEGNFYYSKAGPVRPGGQGWEITSDHNGCVLKVSRDGSKFSVFATGVRAPNGMSTGPNGEMTVGDNEGTWTPACRLSFVRKGSFLGVVDLSKKTPLPTAYDPPICFLPHSDVDNSSGGQVWVTSDKWGPFKNRLLHTSYGTCSLFLVSYEFLDEQGQAQGFSPGSTATPQGGVIRFPLQFQTGICRPRFNSEDGQLYVAGLRGWQTTAVKDAALQRVRYTGKPLKMPTEFHVKPTGIEISFSTPLDSATAADVNNYAVEQWNLHWTGDYGSAEYSVAEPKEKSHDPVEVSKAVLSPDHKTVTLMFDEIQPVMQMKIQMKLKSADGAPMEYSIYNTINKVPGKGDVTAESKAPTTQAAAE